MSQSMLPNSARSAVALLLLLILALCCSSAQAADNSAKSLLRGDEPLLLPSAATGLEIRRPLEHCLTICSCIWQNMTYEPATFWCNAHACGAPRLLICQGTESGTWLW
jgi:hypothetical protein